MVYFQFQARSCSCSVFEAELAEHIPVIKTSIAGTRLVGRMTVGKWRSGDAELEEKMECASLDL